MLSGDIMRCHKSDCSMAGECARYLLRAVNVHGRTPQFAGCVSAELEYFIQATEQEKEIVREDKN